MTTRFLIGEVGRPLTGGGYVRVIATDETATREVNLLAGWRCTDPALLRRAARLFVAAADWLEQPARAPLALGAAVASGIIGWTAPSPPRPDPSSGQGGLFDTTPITEATPCT